LGPPRFIVTSLSWTASSLAKTGEDIPFDRTHRMDDSTLELLFISSDYKRTLGQIMSSSFGHSKLIASASTCSPHRASLRSEYLCFESSNSSIDCISSVYLDRSACKLALNVARVALASFNSEAQ